MTPRAGALAVVVAACGGPTSSSHDAPAGSSHVIGGGGVADAPLAGTLHVYVVEDRSSTPIVGAAVRVEHASSPLTATTDATGLASFSDPALTGAVTVTATAPAHAAATWIGVAGANATLPLEPSPRTVATASVTGTIAGWNALPAPAFGHYNLAVVTYSWLPDPTAPDNSIAQPTSGTTPLNTCIDSGGGGACAWQMTARTGDQIHTAVIVDGDAHGTTDPSDDTYTLIGYAQSAPMTLAAGQTITGESLAMVTDPPTTSQIQFPAPPSGLPHAFAIGAADRGTSGRTILPLPQATQGATTLHFSVPASCATCFPYVYGLATPSATATAPFSSSFGKVGASTLPAWLAPPAVAAPAPPSYTFTPAAGAAFHTARFSTAPQTAKWNVLVLDGSTTFALPAVSPDPLGTGAITLAVAAGDAPGFDAKHFDIPTATTSLVRASGGQTTFTH